MAGFVATDSGRGLAVAKLRMRGLLVAGFEIGGLAVMTSVEAGSWKFVVLTKIATANLWCAIIVISV